MKMARNLRSGDERERQEIKPCSVVLDPHEVVRYLCRKPEQQDPMYSIWMSPEEASLLHSISTVGIQDQCSTEHIKLEYVPSDDMDFVDESLDFLSHQLDDMEDVPEQHFVPSYDMEESKDFLSRQLCGAEEMDDEDTISLPEEYLASLELNVNVEDQILSHQLEKMGNDVPLHQLGNTKNDIESHRLPKMEGITLPYLLGKTKNEIPSHQIGKTKNKITSHQVGKTNTDIPSSQLGKTKNKITSCQSGNTKNEIRSHQLGKTKNEIQSHQLGKTKKDISSSQLGKTKHKITSHQLEKTKNDIPSHQIGKTKNDIQPHQLEKTKNDIPSHQIGNKEGGIPSIKFKNVETISDRITSEQLKKLETITDEIPPHPNFEAGMKYIRIPPQGLTIKKIFNFSKVSKTVCDSKKSNFLLKFVRDLPSKNPKILQKVKFLEQNSVFVYVERKSERNLKLGSALYLIEMNGSRDEQETIKTINKIKPENLLEAKMKMTRKKIETVANFTPKFCLARFYSRKPQLSYNDFMCVMCKELQSDSVVSCDLLEFSEHLDIHYDTSFRTCPHCSQACINVNHYYLHVKNCVVNLHIEREISFINYVHPGKDKLIQVAWEIKCNSTKCGVRLPNLCSKLIHDASCRVSFSSQLRIVKFYLNLHDSCFTCKGCNAVFKDQILFQAHCTPSVIFTESLTHCKQCDMNMETQQHEYMMHMQSGDHEFKCELCLKSFLSADNYIKHKSSEHNVRMVQCSGCSKTVPLVEFQSQHVYICCVSDTFCILCGRICKKYFDLIAHMNQDLLGVLRFEFQCRKCLNYFCSKFNLCCHLKESECGLDKVIKC